MSTTINLADFGYREKKMAAKLLLAMCEHGLPEDFSDSAVTVMMNQSSGNVFLTNDEYEVAMLTSDGKLESWYYTPYKGYEGFYEDLIDMYKNGDIDYDEDVEYLKNLAENRGKKLPRRKKQKQ